LLEGMYTAAAGMAAQQARLDAVANDLSNINTTGYKHVRLAFRDLVYQEAGPGGARGVQTGAGAAATVIGRSAAQGSFQETGEPLDVAVDGPGFIQVKLADGRAALTRDGNLQVDASGRLQLHTGELLEPPVRIPAGASLDRVMIAQDGRVSLGKQQLGRIRLVDVAAPGRLPGGADNTFLPTAASGPIRAAAAGTTLQQRVLEASNVDAADALTGMIESQRAFELASKAIHTADQMWEIANGVKR
jgi:flagellar basal-body rod protein FlgG